MIDLDIILQIFTEYADDECLCKRQNETQVLVQLGGSHEAGKANLFENLGFPLPRRF